jgi:type IV secretion system protein VirB9
MNRFLFLSLLCCADVPAADAPKPEPPPAVVDPAAAARVVQYGNRDVVAVRARVRFTTLIVLPKTEQIMDFVCGDREFWVVNGAQNFAYVKPAKAGSRTNLNLVAASGNVYSFLLSESADGAPDLKVFIEPRDELMISALAGAPRFVPVQQLEDFQQQAEIAKVQAREAKKAAQAAIDGQISAFREQYPSKMKFSYRFERDRRPFQVNAIFHDDKFTYIQASPEETPALYEVKDGQPNLVNFQYKAGTYVVDKILGSGYLAIGRQKLPFFRQE